MYSYFPFFNFFLTFFNFSEFQMKESLCAGYVDWVVSTFGREINPFCGLHTSTKFLPVST
jgi:hypothetical protein